MTPRNLTISFVLVLTSIGGVVTYFNTRTSEIPAAPAIGVVVQTTSVSDATAMVKDLKGKRVYYGVLPSVPQEVINVVQAAPSVATMLYKDPVDEALAASRLKGFMSEREKDGDFAVIKL